MTNECWIKIHYFLGHIILENNYSTIVNFLSYYSSHFLQVYAFVEDLIKDVIVRELRLGRLQERFI